ncbi:phage tail protein [Halodesulfovibrio aestuarii]|uniref:phage tail-collar fiber domain-containing protein n=1 Tax=Halodesulfovibrio aestuarii TaxID=126333 RepID=UPI003D3533B5
MPDFYTVVTDTGLQALGLASTQGQSFSLTHAIVGDGNGLAVIPNKGMTALVNEVWRGEVAGVKVDSDDPNTFIFEFAIPADTGGFTIREVGLLDESGKLFCIGNFPDTEKPVAVNGSVRDLVVRLPLHFENADEVNLVIDTAVALATKQDVLDHNADPLAHRLATTAQTGFVRLATDEEHVAHECETVAATPLGVWKLIEAVKSDAVDLASSLGLATSQAVKSVMDALSLHTNDVEAHSTGIRGGIELFDGAVNADGRPIDCKTGQPDLNYGVCDGRTYAAPDGRMVTTIDARDRFVVTAGGKYFVGSKGGAEQVTTTVDQTAAHDHDLLAGLPGTNVQTGSNSRYASIRSFETTPRGHISTTGGSQAHENRPPYIGLFLIKRL